MVYHYINGIFKKKIWVLVGCTGILQVAFKCAYLDERDWHRLKRSWRNTGECLERRGPRKLSSTRLGLTACTAVYCRRNKNYDHVVRADRSRREIPVAVLPVLTLQSIPVYSRYIHVHGFYCVLSRYSGNGVTVLGKVRSPRAESVWVEVSSTRGQLVIRWWQWSGGYNEAVILHGGGGGVRLDCRFVVLWKGYRELL